MTVHDLKFDSLFTPVILSFFFFSSTFSFFSVIVRFFQRKGKPCKVRTDDLEFVWVHYEYSRSRLQNRLTFFAMIFYRRQLSKKSNASLVPYQKIFIHYGPIKTRLTAFCPRPNHLTLILLFSVSYLLAIKTRTSLISYQKFLACYSHSFEGPGALSSRHFRLTSTAIRHVTVV